MSPRPRPSRGGPRPINLLKYHRKKVNLTKNTVPVLTKESRQCLRNLVSYRTPKPRMKFSRSRCAAVLVALFVGRSGDLHVLLSRRAATLRSYAGDTSLPGGKVDPEDRTFEDTARREAFEEIGLPMDKRKAPLLCVMEPFMASNQLIVTPVVVLIVDNTIRPILNSAEVASLFSHPLKGFIQSESPFSDLASLEVPYHSHRDFNTIFGPGKIVRQYRMHQFLTGRESGGTKPVFGLTASILIEAATIAYGRSPEFEEQPEGAPTAEERIAWTMLTVPAYREAFEQEGIKVEWDAMRKIVEEATQRDRPTPHSRTKGNDLPLTKSKL